jgi:hypothetical protein
MVKKTSRVSLSRRTPARRRTGTRARSARESRGDAARSTDPTVTAQLFDTPRNLWKAGVEVLSAGTRLSPYPTALRGGLRKLEEVFDQRVMDALGRASMPPPELLRQLADRVAALEAQVRRLSGRRRRG